MRFSSHFYKYIGYICVTKFKSIKKTAKIVGFVGAGIVLFFALLYVLLQNSSIQQVIAQNVVKQLSEKLHTKVTLGEINYKLFNVISIDDLYVEDQHRDTLLYVGNADAHFKLWDFFKGKIIFTSVELDRFSGHLKIDKNGHSNIEFIIKAFSKPQKKDTSAVEYQIKEFKLKNSTFTYYNAKSFKPAARGLFNGNDLRLRAINANIALNYFKKDSIDVEIASLSAIEHSGLVLKEFRTRATGMKHGIRVPELFVALPASEVRFENIALRYDSIADFKRFVDKVKLSLPLISSRISPSDLATFVPQLRNVKGEVRLKALLNGRVSSLHMQKMELKYNKSLLFKADLDVNGLPELADAFVYGKINDLVLQPMDFQDVLSKMSQKPVVFPQELARLGTLKYKGNITGFLTDLVAYGNLNTALGSISTDLLVKLENQFHDLAYNGTVQTTNFQLGKLLNNPKLGKIAFKVNSKGTRKDKMPVQGVITANVGELQFNNYTYRDINFDGKFDGRGFNGKAGVEDENIHARFNGIVDLTQKLPVYKFGLKVKETNLEALHLIKKYTGARLSFNVNTNISGNSINNVNGSVLVDSIEFVNKGKVLNAGQVQILSRNFDRQTRITIASDYVNGALSGNFKYATLGLTLNKILQKYLPSLSVPLEKVARMPNQLDFDFSISNINEITDVLEMSYKLNGVAHLKGAVDESVNKVEFVGAVPSLQVGNQLIDNVYLHVDNPKQNLQFTGRAQLHAKDGIMNVFSSASARQDSVQAQMGWQNSQKITNAGEIKVAAGFRKENGKTASRFTVLPTQVIVNDSVWDIHRSLVEFNTDSTINIHNFLFDCHKQFVHINGVASNSQTDNIKINLNDISLDFVFGLIKLKAIGIGGNVSGNVTLFSLMKQPFFEADLGLNKATLNHQPVGDAKVHATWDKLNSQIVMDAVFANDQKERVAVVGGVYVPRNDSLDLTFDTHGFNIAFLNRYFESVVQDFRGAASGKVRMFGPTRHICFEGDALVKGGQATVKMLKTTYFFNDSVHLARKAIMLNNIKIYDQERNPGTLKGVINHSGSFSQMVYDVRMNGRNILALNTRTEDNDYFFGKAYANGNVHIFGDEKVCNIWVDAVSQPRTKCFVNMGSASSAKDNSFITFVKKDRSIRKDVVVSKPVVSNSGMNVKVNLQMSVTPDAEMEMIIDPKGGDVVTGRGDGNLRVEFDTYSDIKLYGTYTIQNNGYYLFTLQNLFKKEFKIDKGSTLVWTGSPYHAQVNIRALYPLSASLKDLEPDADKQTTSNRASVPVNCVLKLTDDLMKPTIKFDIDLPQSEESVKQKVKDIVNTDEMMNRQILYLLLLGKFYTPEYTQATNSAFGANEAFAFGLSTLSAQVNSWLSKAVSNVSIGLDYKQRSDVTANESESQFSTQLLYQPNNRVIINGNFGYSTENANVSTNNNKFIGDIDLEYLLTESGKIRLKAYNHTVDRTRLITAKTTQGVGVLYKEDFESPGAMLNYYWNMISGKSKKKNNEEKQK
ncbi:MAG: hypothetical protein RIS29_397 [Bacteroidota bacterium]|jgi:hypothetical protein